jgi:hypothetical protein
MSELQEAYAKLERIAKKYAPSSSDIQKSMRSHTPQSAKVARAVAITKATANNPRLTRRILELEKAEYLRKQLAPVMRRYMEDDDWSREFSEA